MGKKITFRRFRICENMWWTRYREALTHWQIQNVKFDLWMKKDKPIVCLLMTWTNVEFWWKMYVHTSNYNELMGSNHQITNLVLSNFLTKLFSIENKNNLCVGPKQFFIQTGLPVEKKSLYIFVKKFVGLEFVVWWFDPMSLL